MKTLKKNRKDEGRRRRADGRWEEDGALSRERGGDPLEGRYRLDEVVRAYPGEPGVVSRLDLVVMWRLPLFESDEDFAAASAVIDAALPTYRAALLGYVFLPSELHLLVTWHGMMDDGRILRGLKNRIGRRMADRMNARRRRPGFDPMASRDGRRFWDASSPWNLPRAVHPQWFERELAWWHDQPAKRGLCARAEDWEWSSWHEYADAEGPRRAGRPGVNPVRRDAARWTVGCGWVYGGGEEREEGALSRERLARGEVRLSSEAEVDEWYRVPCHWYRWRDALSPGVVPGVPMQTREVARNAAWDVRWF